MAQIPVTETQRKLVLQHRLYPQDASFNLAVVYRIEGPLDVPRLRTALERVLTENPTLNAVFDPDGEDRVARRGTGRPDVAVLEVPGGLDRDGEADHVAVDVGRRADVPIPPDRWPLYEVTLHVGAHGCYLGIICSHLISDAITMFNIADLMSELYAGNALSGPLSGGLSGDDVPVRSTAPEAAVAAFQELLAGVQRLTHEQLSTPRLPGGVLPGRRYEWPLDRDLAEAVRRSPLTSAHGAFAVFVAAHAVMLAALTGQSSVVVGVPMATRRGGRQMYALGYFINTLPLALDLDRFDAFADLCAAVTARVTTMLRHRDFDLTAHAAEVFADRRVSPLLMDNVITFYRKQFPLRLPGCRIDPLFVPRSQVRYPLAVNVLDDGEGYIVGLEHVDQLTDARPLACLETVLRQVLAAPEMPLRNVGVLDDAEERRLDRVLNGHREYAVPESLDAAFTAAARTHALRVAVSDAAGSWTYAELDAAATRVATALTAAGCGPAVAVTARRRRELVAVLLGVLRAGKSYVPLDPQAPPQRLAHIADRFGGPEHLPLIADDDLLLGAAFQPRFSVDDVVGGVPSRQPVPIAPPSADSIAYTIFTSGSTGVPKGVEVTHRNVLRLIASGDDHYDFGPEDVWCLFHSYAFDVSVWEIFGSLLHGGRLHVVADDVVRSPADFAELLADQQVTVLNQTPSAFRWLLGDLTPERADRLAVRWVVFAGEALHFDMLRPWVDLVGARARLANMYGITETTVHTTFYEVLPESVGVERSSLIGRPLGDLSLAVVDRNLNRVPVGVPGELLVAGPGVARGYRGRPEDNARRFLRGTRYGDVVYRSGDRVVLRPDGVLEYRDRIDRQVQLRGYRIEPGEVENALRALPGVKDAYVAMRTAAGDEPCLVAWLVTPDSVTDAELRAALREHVPAYMVPAVLIRLEELPLTVNGKVDTAALPAPVRPEPNRAPEGTAARVAELWLEIVGCGPVGADDNFFDVGGTSMHVARIHRRLVAEFGAADLSMLELFEFPTPRSLAERIDRTAGGVPAATVPRPRRNRSGAARRRRDAAEDVR